MATCQSQQGSRAGSVATICSSRHLVQVSTKRFSNRHKTMLLILALPLLIVLCLLFMVLFIVYHYKYSSLLDDVCTSKECVDTASTLLQLMDVSKDPCQDFYAFACGRFADEHPVEDGGLYRSWFEHGEEQLTRMVRKLLDSPDNSKYSQAFNMTRRFYRSCTDTDRREEAGLQPLYELLERVGLPKFPTKDTAPSFQLGRTLGLLQRHLNMDVIVQLGIGRTNESYILEVLPMAPGGSSFRDFSLTSLAAVFPPEGIRKEPWTPDVSSAVTPRRALMHRLTFMSTVIKIMQDGLGEENRTQNAMLKDALKILTFSAQLDEVVEEGSNGTDEGQLMTFAALQDAVDESSPTPSKATQVTWQDYVDGLMEGEEDWKYDVNLNLVNAITLNAHKALATFLADSKPESIERFVWWSVVQEYARHTTQEMGNAYRSLSHALLGPGSGSSVSVAHQCVAHVRRLLHFPVAREVKREFHLASNTDKVVEMLSDIQAEFEKLVHAASWMDLPTKNLNIDKARAISHVIGYEHAVLDARRVDAFYTDLAVERSEFAVNMAELRGWEMRQALQVLHHANASALGSLSSATNPLQVNAYYARSANAIYVPAGILQRPFYYRGLECLNYGAMGSILGHELTHGFDSEGRNFDRHGQRQEQYWSADVTAQFHHRAQCFVQQYGLFYLTNNTRLDGNLTLGENIADNGGLRESLFAYRTFQQRHGPEPKLPGLQHFSSEQLLFLSFATIWCEASTERYFQLSSQDNHSPNRVRVLATLQNMQEFADAFQCPLGSPMNPPDKCIVW